MDIDKQIGFSFGGEFEGFFLPHVFEVPLQDKHRGKAVARSLLALSLVKRRTMRLKY